VAATRGETVALRMAAVRIRIHLFDMISSRLQLLGVMIWSTTDTFSFQEAQWIC
jgi:hypothetical protein